MDIKDKIKLSQNIAVVSGIFCITVALLLLLNFMQMSKNDPTDSKVIQALVERLKQDPNDDALKMEIRNYDLLARKAYFNSQWQVKTGAYLLLFGAIILAFSLRFYYSLKAKIDEPDTQHENEIASRILAQKGIIIVGAVVLALAFGASLLTVNQLKYYDVGDKLTSANPTPEEEGIQVIEVGKSPESDSDKSLNTGNTASANQNENQTADNVENAKDESQATEVKKEEPTTAISGSKDVLAEVRKNSGSFRGPLSQGVSFSKNIPTKWDGGAGTNILWKSPIPKKGFNSPIIWGDKIFLGRS